jgi:hypothetical protein
MLAVTSMANAQQEGVYTIPHYKFETGQEMDSQDRLWCESRFTQRANVVEVGANLGLHSVPLAKFTSGGKVICSWYLVVRRPNQALAFGIALWRVLARKRHEHGRIISRTRHLGENNDNQARYV